MAETHILLILRLGSGRPGSQKNVVNKSDATLAASSKVTYTTDITYIKYITHIYISPYIATSHSRYSSAMFAVTESKSIYSRLLTYPKTMPDFHEWHNNAFRWIRV